jgi:hypothetical protein
MKTPTYLTLRHTSPPGLFPLLFALLTKWRLVTRYPHAGVVIDGVGSDFQSSAICRLKHF